MTSYAIQASPVFLILIVLTLVCWQLKRERPQFNRVAYFQKEKRAMFKIMVLGMIAVYLFSAIIYSTLEPWDVNILADLFLPIAAYALLISWGKKEEAQ